MSLKGGKCSQQQSSILNFLKKEQPKKCQELDSKSKVQPVKPVAAVTPIQVNQRRGTIVDTVDLTQSPDLLNDQDDEVFESMPIVPQDSKTKESQSYLEKKEKEESWLTQIYGKTPPYPSSSESSPISSERKERPGDQRSSQAAKSLKFDETKSPWDDDDDDFQVEVTKNNKSKNKSESFYSKTSGSKDKAEFQVEPDFCLNHEISVEEDDFDVGEVELLPEEEPAFLDQNFDEVKNSFDDDDHHFSPPHTPPPCDYLETCPPSKFNFKPKVSKSSPQVAESQDIIDPSPVKQPTRRISSTAGRSRLSSNRKISPGTSKNSLPSLDQKAKQKKGMPEQSSSVSSKSKVSETFKSPKAVTKTVSDRNSRVISTAASHLHELDKFIRKTQSFNKNVDRMVISDIQKHKDWKIEFEKEFTQFFLNINFLDPRKSQEAAINKKIEDSKECYKKICSRLEQREKLKTESYCDEPKSSTSKLLNTYVPELSDAPSGDYDESPPFDFSENEPEYLPAIETKSIPSRSSSEEVDYPSSPILSRNSSFDGQISKKNSVQFSNKTRVSLENSFDGTSYGDRVPMDKIAGTSSANFDDNTSSQSSSGSTAAKPSKFKFKRPGAGASSLMDASPLRSSSGSVVAKPTSGAFTSPPAQSSSDTGWTRYSSSIPNTPDHVRSSDSGIFSKPNSGAKSSLLQESGTQFIEDFNSQFTMDMLEGDDGFEEEEIDYNKQLYETQSSFSRSPGTSSHNRKSGSNAGAQTNFDGKFIGEARNDGKDTFLSAENHSFSPGLRKVLTEKFGMRNYRPNQLQAVNSAVLGNDTFVLMPTGGGKSLCYQLPAAFQGGITVVVSPLVSLIQDQVTKLNGMNISADHLSGDDYARQSRIYTQMRGRVPGPTLLYVTPEKITSSNQLRDALMSVYNQDKLQRFVIDEAHCVSQWGHDFRPDYKKLSMLRTKFPNVPMMALTATATPRVRTDILFQLKMKNPKWFLSSFNRANLKYEVRQKKGKSVTKEIASVIQISFRRQSGIVYCLSKRECEETAKFLVTAGIPAAPYHAGLAPDVRFKTQDDWVQDKIRVVCATIAFGMGIDKPDVRFVLHQSLPKSIEGYYQESGRAGRDGEPSRCILFYHYADMHRLRKLIDMGDGDQNAKKVHYENLWQMVRYAENLSDCRRVLQLQYFGEVFDHNRCGDIANMKCDNCSRNSTTTIEKVDISETAKQIVLAVQRLSSRPQYRNFTINQFVDIWRGMKNQKTVNSRWDTDPIYGKGKVYNALEANRILKLMVIESYLWENMVINKDQIATAYLVPGMKAKDLISGQCTVLHQTEGKAVVADEAEVSSEADPRLSQLQEDAFNELKHLVLMTGREMQPEKQIKGVNELIPLQALKQISDKLPVTMDALGKIEYMTSYRISLYGEIILSTCNEYSERRMEYLASQAQANHLAREEEEFVPGGEDGGGWLGKSSGRGKSRYFRGKKRGGGSYKRKRTGSNQGGGYPKKRSYDGGSGGSGYKRGGGGSSGGGGRGARGGAARGGSMGLPKRMGVNA